MERILETLKDDIELLETARLIVERTEINGNSLKNAVRYIREIKLRDKTGCSEIMRKIDADAVFGNTDLNRRTKSEEIIKRLYALRYPLWSAKQAEFTKLRNKFRALTGGEIEFPEFAEGNSIKIIFTVRKEEDADKMIEAVSKGAGIVRESLKKVKE